MGISVPGVGTAISAAGAGILSIFSSLFGDSSPPPPEISGFTWSEFEKNLRNGILINNRMAEVLGAATASKPDTSRIASTSIGAIAEFTQSLWITQLNKLKSGGLDLHGKRKLALFATFAGSKQLAKWTDAKDMHYAAGLIAYGSQVAVLRRAIEFTFLHDLRMTLGHPKTPNPAFPVGWYQGLNISYGHQDPAEKRDNLAQRTNATEWQDVVTTTLFPINDIGETPILLTTDFLKSEVKFYNDTNDKEVFRLKVGNIDTFKFAITDMPKAIARAYELGRSGPKAYLNNYKDALRTFHALQKKETTKAKSKGAFARAAKAMKKVSATLKKREDQKNIGVVATIAAAAGLYFYLR